MKAKLIKSRYEEKGRGEESTGRRKRGEIAFEAVDMKLLREIDIARQEEAKFVLVLVANAIHDYSVFLGFVYEGRELNFANK